VTRRRRRRRLDTGHVKLQTTSLRHSNVVKERRRAVFTWFNQTLINITAPCIHSSLHAPNLIRGSHLRHSQDTDTDICLLVLMSSSVRAGSYVTEPMGCLQFCSHVFLVCWWQGIAMVERRRYPRLMNTVSVLQSYTKLLFNPQCLRPHNAMLESGNVY
jgi:hypothetical protein